MRYSRFIIAALVLTVPTAAAQRVSSFGPEIRPFIGAYVPTGDQRSDFKTGTIVGAQAAFEVSDYLHLVSSVGYAFGHHKYSGYSTDNTAIWSYDVGGEVNLLNEWSDNWLFKPFVGLGAGARSYDYQARNMTTRTCTAGYGALGTEFQNGAVALRLEARDYLTCFKSPATGRNHNRNDATLSFGMAYHIR